MILILDGSHLTNTDKNYGHKIYISTTVKKDLDTIVKAIGLKEIQGNGNLP